MNKYLQLIRVNNWVKNGLIALPFIFTPSLWSVGNIGVLLVAVLCWSLVASAGYIINDILDAENDKKHIRKQHRPIASGAIPVSQAMIIAVLLILVAVVLLALFNPLLLYVYGAYLVLNIAYSVYLKTLRFVDILVLTSFYMLRIMAGGMLFDIKITTWFFITSFFGFLAISVKKREMETYSTKEEKVARRGYAVADGAMLNVLSYVSAFVSLVFLNLHTILFLKTENILLLLTTNILALYLIFRFLDRERIKEDPTQTFLSSASLIVVVLLMIAIYVFMITSSLQ